MRFFWMIFLIIISAGFTSKKSTFVTMTYRFPDCPIRDIEKGRVQKNFWTINVKDTFLEKKLLKISAVKSVFLKTTKGIEMGIKLYRDSHECKVYVLASVYKVDDNGIKNLESNVRELLSTLYGVSAVLSGEVVVLDNSKSDSKIIEDLKRVEKYIF